MNADIYIKAAEMISLGHSRWSCFAITDATDLADLPLTIGYGYVAAYSALFGPTSGAEHEYHPWWDKHALDGQELRVLALCFMAAIVEAGDA
jgi:hypothetical protein